MSEINVREHINQIHDRVSIYLSVNRFDAAEKLLRASIAEYGSFSNLHNLMGITFHKQSRFIEALVEFNKALVANPKFVEAGINLTITLCDLGRYNDARNIFDRLTQVSYLQRSQPNLVLGRIANQHARNGKSYEECGMFNDAIHEYRRALHLYQNLPDVRLSLAKLYIKLANFEKAKTELEALINSRVERSEAFTLLGIIHYKLGHLTDATAAWHRATATNPNDQTSQIYLKISQRFS